MIPLSTPIPGCGPQTTSSVSEVMDTGPRDNFSRDIRTVSGIQLHEACAPVQSVTRRGPQSHPALAAWQHTPDSHAVMQSCSAADWWPLLQPPVMLSPGAWSRLTAAGLFNTPHTPQHSTAGHGWSSLFSLIQQYGHYRFQQVLLKMTLYLVVATISKLTWKIKWIQIRDHSSVQGESSWMSLMVRAVQS